MIRRYATPLAFKQALEQRIKSSSTTGADFARRRQVLAFDRFLARVVSVVGDGDAQGRAGPRNECRLAGAIYSRPFGVDVAFGDPLVGEPDLAVADDLLNFAGIAPPMLRLYPVVSHIAEKLHALTLPRDRPNLATTGPIEGAKLRLADLENARGGHGSRLCVSRPRARFGQLRDLGAEGLALETPHVRASASNYSRTRTTVRSRGRSSLHPAMGNPIPSPRHLRPRL